MAVGTAEPFMATSDLFCTAVRQEFGFLVSQYGFVPKDSINEGWSWSCVTFEAPRLSISVHRNYRDGFGMNFLVKADTFWIRPASTRNYDINDLLWILDPKALFEVRRGAAEATDATELSAILHCWADLLLKYAAPLLRGDLGLCEDILITKACQMKMTTPLADYIKVFREEIVDLPAKDREHIEDAFAQGNPKFIFWALEAQAKSKRLLGRRFLQTLGDFRGQFLYVVSV